MKPENSDLHHNNGKGQFAESIDLFKDPDYADLLDCYQRAEFTKCAEGLEKLEKKYPEHPELLTFKDDLHLKMSIKNFSMSTDVEEKNRKKKVIINLGIFAIAATLVVMVIFFFLQYFFNDNVNAKQLEKEAAYLASLEYQADRLLQGGQPQPAAEIIAQIRKISPEFESLPELISRKDKLLQLEAEYQSAVDLIAENKNEEALDILKKIAAEKPGMWDVDSQISSIETSFQIAEYLVEGNAAYQREDWNQVIGAYESALKLNPTLNDPLMNEQLLNGYLNTIISMLEDNDSTIGDFERAEEYYRRAVALASQSKAFTSERENLQKVSSNLLGLKYIQMAKTYLNDENQTVLSVSKAVSYLKKAVNIDPDNTTLISDLRDAENYQNAFNHFIDMNWEQVITNLNLIPSLKSNYAGGNASLMLYYAYYELGKQYASFGLYLDAISDFQQAEILAWSDSNNLIKLFQIQTLLGDTFGKINDFGNAVSYYQYAINAVQADKRLTNYPDIAVKLTEANALAANGKFEDAYKHFQEVLGDIGVIYTVSEIEISDGACLAFFANKNRSTMDGILQANNLPMNMTIAMGRKLKVPIIEKID